MEENHEKCKMFICDSIFIIDIDLEFDKEVAVTLFNKKCTFILHPSSSCSVIRHTFEKFTIKKLKLRKRFIIL